jgi:predicted phosphodiesterase
MPPNQAENRSMAEGPSNLLAPVLDLGTLPAPLIAFGGPLGNLDALEALFHEARRLGIAPQNMICTGDIAAYCAEPEACARMLMDAGVHVLMGNCEESLALDAEDCGCNFVAGSTCARLADDWYRFTRGHIAPETRAWMATLPRRMTFTMGGARCAVIHGGGGQINRYLFASDRAGLAQDLRALAADVVIAGHGGLPFTTDIEDALWHNPGALGMPANDGTPRVWYSLITVANNELVFEHRPLDYDYRGQARKMRAARLPGAYAQALETGLWPDVAILPSAEAAATGQPLHALSIGWGNLSVTGG